MWNNIINNNRNIKEKELSMYFHSFNVGYIDIPNTITLNIYTVGCVHNCPGCHSTDLQNFNHSERKELTADLILEKLNNANGFYEGVCWLGGDPLFQFEEFIKINQELKRVCPNILITCFTGYEYTQMSEEQQNKLCSCVDVLVDGKWQGKMLHEDGCNQKIWVNKNNVLEEISYLEFKNKEYLTGD
jgi:anaerobic ribonucleoside-triphosphate reductase activating protein